MTGVQTCALPISLALTECRTVASAVETMFHHSGGEGQTAPHDPVADSPVPRASRPHHDAFCACAESEVFIINSHTGSAFFPSFTSLERVSSYFGLSRALLMNARSVRDAHSTGLSAPRGMVRPSSPTEDTHEDFDGGEDFLDNKPSSSRRRAAMGAAGNAIISRSPGRTASSASLNQVGFVQKLFSYVAIHKCRRLPSPTVKVKDGS